MKKTRIILATVLTVAIVLIFVFKVFFQEGLESPASIKDQKLSKALLISVNLSGRIVGAKNTMTFVGSQGGPAGEIGLNKTIKVAADGSFKVKLTLPRKDNNGGYYKLIPAKGKVLFLYLKDGYNLTVTDSLKNIGNRKNAKFTGNGAIQNRIEQFKYNISRWTRENMMGELDRRSLNKKIQDLKNSTDSLYATYKNMGIDSFISRRKVEDKIFYNHVNTNYETYKLSKPMWYLELPAFIKYQKLSKEQLISVNLSGRIAGAKNTIAFVGSFKGTVGEPNFKKTIKVATDGSFKVKLTLPKKDINQGVYSLTNNKPGTLWFFNFYLEDGYNLTINTSIKEVQGEHKMSVKFTGNGAIQNRLIQDFNNIRFSWLSKNGHIFSLDKKSFDKEIQALKNSADSLYSVYKNRGIDRFIARIKMEHKDYYDYLLSMLKEKKRKKSQ